MFYHPFIDVIWVIKIKQISSDVYEVVTGTIIKINEITYYKSEYHLSFENSCNIDYVIIYKKFLDESQYKTGSKIIVLQGKNNILI